MFGNKKKLVQLLISVALMAGLIYFVDIENTVDALANANLVYLVLALLLVTFNRILMPVKWNLLLRVKGIDLSWGEVTRVYYIASFLGTYLPPTIGADVLRAYYVAREKYPLRDIVSSILVERLLGLIALLLFALAGVILFTVLRRSDDLEVHRLPTIVLVLTAIVLAGFFASLTTQASRLIHALPARVENKRWLGNLMRQLVGLYDSYFQYRNHKAVLFAFFLLTCLEVCLPILRAFLVALSLGLEVPLWYFFTFAPIILLLIRLPISFDGFGIQEGGFVYFLALVGVPDGVGFSVGLLNHLLFLVALLPGAIFYALDAKRKEVLSGAENISLRNK